MHRLQSKVRKTTIFSDVFNDIQEYAVVSYGELLDDEHLIYCETAFHTAISSGCNKVVKELISKDKSALACQDHSGRTPLHEVAQRNNREIVTLLLKEDQREMESTCDYKGYQFDSFYRNLLIMSHAELMEYKREKCSPGYTPLHDLLRNRAMVGARDCLGVTPLHVAACHNHQLVVKVLVKFGVNISSETLNGSTPLHSAAACGALEVTNQLVHHGAIPDATDDNNLSALHYCILDVHSNHFRDHLAKFYSDDKNYVRNTNYFQWLDVFIDLMLLGSNINAVDVHGQSVLHIAAKKWFGRRCQRSHAKKVTA